MFAHIVAIRKLIMCLFFSLHVKCHVCASSLSPPFLPPEVHAMLDAFLPPDTYFRFNPYMSEDISMDESRQEKLSLLQAEGVRYLERNEEKLKKVTRILTREKSSVQRMAEWARLRADMYNGLSFQSSKL